MESGQQGSEMATGSSAERKMTFPSITVSGFHFQYYASIGVYQYNMPLPVKACVGRGDGITQHTSQG